MKPPYKVPSMEEINALPWNGLSVASTFSGCGGSSLGYRMAGFKVLWASEFIDAARDTYKANSRDWTVLDGRDIREVKPEEVLSAMGKEPGELDLFDGSPPCSAFSTAGKRDEGWGKVRKYSDKSQRVDDLFFEFIRLLRGIRPKTFVAENVSGLVKGVAKGYFMEIMKELRESGYVVQCRVLDAQWLGVPQARKRTIFIGVREDLRRAPQFPRPLGYRYAVKDALPWIGQCVHDTSGEDGAGDVTHRPCPAITVGMGSINSYHFRVTDISRFAIGKEWDKLKPGEQSERYFNLVRSHPDQPSPTICASHGNIGMAGVTHPTEKRKFTIEELKRICGFPDDFRLTGTFQQQWERLGRAVPPVIMFHIAACLRDQVLNPQH